MRSLPNLTERQKEGNLFALSEYLIKLGDIPYKQQYIEHYTETLLIDRKKLHIKVLITIMREFYGIDMHKQYNAWAFIFGVNILNVDNTTRGIGIRMSYYLTHKGEINIREEKRLIKDWVKLYNNWWYTQIEETKDREETKYKTQ